MPYDDQRPKVDQPRIKLADLRKSHRLTQDEVAGRVASIIDKQFLGTSLSLIEGGHRGASDEILRALEQVFGLGAGSITVSYKPSHSRRAQGSIQAAS